VTRIRALELDAAAYPRHSLHADDRVWVEKNCYVDVWIEVIHSVGCDPMAILPFVVAIDFEGDQWTFFKPPHDELRELYGIDVQELNCWKPLLEHAVEHLAAGKLIVTDADAWWLPDTSGTDYRRQHTKSSIVLTDLDVAARRLGYFHNAGYFALEGEDFAGTFRLDRAPDPAFMPFYAELVRLDRLVRRPPADLAERSTGLLRKHVGRRPADNPIARFGRRFARDLPAIQDQGLAYYHVWAFATLRQLGAAAELAALFLRWLDGGGTVRPTAGRFAPAVDAYERISGGAKALILKAARAVNTRRALDAAPLFDEWAAEWDRAMATLVQAAA
jgi:hypothetical protein